MEHLRYLRIADRVMAAITGASAIMVLLVALGVLSVGALQGEWVVGGAGGGVLLFVALFQATEVALFLLAAQRILQGRWRLVQTALGVVNLPSVPVGLLFGIYAIWVCWVNEPTREHLGGREGGGSAQRSGPSTRS